MIKISIITVCFNEINTIKRTVESVFFQTYKNIEYIVLDGASNDGTEKYLSSISSQLNFYKSEKDKGIYDAMNKAISHCSGEIVYFLNANDYLYDSTVIEKVADICTNNPSIDIIYGNVAYAPKPGEIYHRENRFFEFFNLNEFYQNNRPQQCFFVNKKLFESVGRFDERYKICADTEWIVRAILLQKTFLYTPLNICVFDENGLSGTQTNNRLKEKRLIIFRLSPPNVLLRYIARGIYTFLKSQFSISAAKDEP